nr:hypothetical protein [Lachnospiraceae bacterium]
AFLQGNLFSFSIFMIGWGIVVQSVFVRTIKTTEQRIRPILVGSVFLAFNIISFFSSFFVLSAPWETMVWASILPMLIKIRNKREN